MLTDLSVLTRVETNTGRVRRSDELINLTELNVKDICNRFYVWQLSVNEMLAETVEPLSGALNLQPSLSFA